MSVLRVFRVKLVSSEHDLYRAAPDVAAETTFYLQMEDSSGQRSISPTFLLSRELVIVRSSRRQLLIHVSPSCERNVG